MAVAKDQIRQIITENNITSVADVYSCRWQLCYLTEIFMCFFPYIWVIFSQQSDDGSAAFLYLRPLHAGTCRSAATAITHTAAIFPCVLVNSSAAYPAMGTESCTFPI